MFEASYAVVLQLPGVSQGLMGKEGQYSGRSPELGIKHDLNPDSSSGKLGDFG